MCSRRCGGGGVALHDFFILSPWISYSGCPDIARRADAVDRTGVRVVSASGAGAGKNAQSGDLALKLNGKDDKLRRGDFRVFASTAGLKAADADAAIDQMLRQLTDAVGRVALPEALEYGEAGEKVAMQVLDICRGRMEAFA